MPDELPAGTTLRIIMHSDEGRCCNERETGDVPEYLEFLVVVETAACGGLDGRGSDVVCPVVAGGAERVGLGDT